MLLSTVVRLGTAAFPPLPCSAEAAAAPSLQQWVGGPAAPSGRIASLVRHCIRPPIALLVPPRLCLQCADRGDLDASSQLRAECLECIGSWVRHCVRIRFTLPFAQHRVAARAHAHAARAACAALPSAQPRQNSVCIRVYCAATARRGTQWYSSTAEYYGRNGRPAGAAAGATAS